MAGAQLIAAQRVPAATFPGLRFVTRTHVSGTSFHRSSNQGKIRKSAANREPAISSREFRQTPIKV